RTLLHIENNQSLQNLSGLENLTFVGEDLKIFNNDLLTDLQGLNSLEYITSVLKIRYNDQLTSLNGLENLDTINGGLSIWDNNVLSSLESISDCYLNFALGIHDNPLLEVCNINSICDFLSGNPSYVDIYNNSPGCNSIEEVEEACDTLGVVDFYEKSILLLHPNPAENEVLITGNNNIFINEINFYSSFGQKVLSIKQIENKIDISELKSGIYFINIVTRQSLISQKLIVK
ncbi:MAG: T9SS type A sorting domain-containing protein, partial [Bacteroidales bacterium]|nr:T9SS type A sorting domain-containing protein [Bacteroidales bacterium]